MNRHVIKFIFLCALSFFRMGEASTSTKVFVKYLNPVFIESGSFYGDGIAMALEAGFPTVHSIELSPYLYGCCDQRFQGLSNVHLHLGDSSQVLAKVLSKVHQRATFWLDGHYSAGITAKGNSYSPILQELAAIAAHPIKNHTILIDDMRLVGTIDFDFVRLGELVEALFKINPQYHIYFEDGYAPNDVLVAVIP